MRYVGKRSLSSVLAAILTAVWVFMWISLIGMVGFGIHSLMAESGANQMAVQIETVGLRISIAGEYLKTPSLGSTALALGVAIPSILLLLVLVYHLRRLMQSLANDEHPFQKSNFVHLRWIGISVLLWAVWSSTAHFVTAWHLVRHVSIPGVHFSAVLKPDVNMLILAGVILIMTEVFQGAVAMREDQDLTI